MLKSATRVNDRIFMVKTNTIDLRASPSKLHDDELSRFYVLKSILVMTS